MDLAEFFIHSIYSLTLLVLILAGYRIVKKFKGGLFSKLFKFVIIGSIPNLLLHIIHSLRYFNIHLMPMMGENQLLIEHLINIFPFAMIILGLKVVQDDYEKIRNPKK